MKRRVKKLLSAVLTMAMVLSLLPAQTLAEEESKEEFILLLVTDGALMMPTNVIGLDGTPVYASEGAYSVYLDADKCPESLKKNKEGKTAHYKPKRRSSASKNCSALSKLRSSAESIKNLLHVPK